MCPTHQIIPNTLVGLYIVWYSIACAVLCSARAPYSTNDGGYTVFHQYNVCSSVRLSVRSFGRSVSILVLFYLHDIQTPQPSVYTGDTPSKHTFNQWNLCFFGGLLQLCLAPVCMFRPFWENKRHALRICVLSYWAIAFDFHSMQCIRLFASFQHWRR